MSNMSYCRFENTYPDLKDCWDAIRNGEADDLSESEQRAKKRLIKLCREIAEEYIGDE